MFSYNERLFMDIGTAEIFTLENLREQFEKLRTENPEDWEGWTFDLCIREWLRCSDLHEIFPYRVFYRVDGKPGLLEKVTWQTDETSARWAVEDIAYWEGAETVEIVDSFWWNRLFEEWRG